MKLKNKVELLLSEGYRFYCQKNDETYLIQKNSYLHLPNIIGPNSLLHFNDHDIPSSTTESALSLINVALFKKYHVYSKKGSLVLDHNGTNFLPIDRGTIDPRHFGWNWVLFDIGPMLLMHSSAKLTTLSMSYSPRYLWYSGLGLGLSASYFLSLVYDDQDTIQKVLTHQYKLNTYYYFQDTFYLKGGLGVEHILKVNLMGGMISFGVGYHPRLPWDWSHYLQAIESSFSLVFGKYALSQLGVSATFGI